jgi:hypothetical protein
MCRSPRFPPTLVAHSSLGRISRHKEAQHSGAHHGTAPSDSRHLVKYTPLIPENAGSDYSTSTSSRGSYHRSAPYPQPAYRGGSRGRFTPTYRNKTLVLNGGAQSAASSHENLLPDPTTPSTPSWVTKTDRHLQLINRDVYERETQQRTQAIEQSLKQKQLYKGYHEKARFFKNMRQAVGDTVIASSNTSRPISKYEVEVEGVRFHVTKQGSKLVKAPGAFHNGQPPPAMSILNDSL